MTGFVANQGQWDAAISFRAIGAASATWVERDRITLGLFDPNRASEEASSSRDPMWAVQLEFLGAGESFATATGTKRLPGEFNYYFGQDPAAWRVGVPHFESVSVPELYPNIDLSLSTPSDTTPLRYDLHLHAGADPRAIRIGVEGALELREQDNGSIEIVTPLGVLMHAPPSAWRILESGDQESIPARFRRIDDHQIELELGSSAIGHEIIVDPDLVWSRGLTPFGDEEQIRDVAVGPEDRIVTVGYTKDIAHPTTPGAFDTSFQPQVPPLGIWNSFVTVYTADGSELVFSSFLGGTLSSYAKKVAVSKAGEITVLGLATGNFPTTAGCYKSIAQGFDSFVTRFTPAGDGLLFSTFVGGSKSEMDFMFIDLFADDSILIGGRTNSPDFPITPGAWESPFGQIFVARLNNTGSALLASARIGGGKEIATDGHVLPDGRIVFSGSTEFSNYPFTPGTMPFPPTPPFSGPLAGVVTFMDAALTNVVLSGTTLRASPWSIDVNDQGDVYIAGDVADPSYPQTPYAVNDQGLFPTETGVFISRLTPDLASFVYSTKFGYTQDGATDLYVDDLGTAVVAGRLSHPSMPTTPGALDTTFNNGFNPFSDDGFLMRVSADGRSLWYSTFVGGSLADRHAALDELNSGAAVLVGSTSSPDYPFTVDTPDPQQAYFAGVITVINMLPPGIDRFGTGTAGCRGIPSIGANRSPELLDPNFALACTHAPKSAMGFLLLGGDALSSPMFASGVTLFVDLSDAVLIPIQSDALGAVFAPLVSHAGSPGATYFAQFVFPDACAVGGWSASNALSIRVRD